MPPGGKETPAYPLNNARADKLGGWPWKAVQRQRCLIPVSGFWEPEKLGPREGRRAWSYYSMRDERPFFVAAYEPRHRTQPRARSPTATR